MTFDLGEVIEDSKRIIVVTNNVDNSLFIFAFFSLASLSFYFYTLFLVSGRLIMRILLSGK